MAVTLKAARVNRGLNQVEASKLIGVSPITLLKWETGKTSPRMSDVQKILKAYDMKLDDIIFFE